jgi:hypothetical protein
LAEFSRCSKTPHGSSLVFTTQNPEMHEGIGGIRLLGFLFGQTKRPGKAHAFPVFALKERNSI